MRLLLDTHLLLWAAGAPDRLPSAARNKILATENTLIFSAASIWEIVIKSALGRSDFQADARRLRHLLAANGYLELAISGEHAAKVAELPPLHKDPFDRILVAQARVEELLLLTSDPTVAAYGERVLHV